MAFWGYGLHVLSCSLRHFFHFVHGVFDEKEIRNFNVVTLAEIFIIILWYRCGLYL